MGYAWGLIYTCHEVVTKNSKESNLGDEGQFALSEQKGTETSSLISGTVKYNFMIQVFLSWENVQSITYMQYMFLDCCLLHALHTSLSCPPLIITHLVPRVV